MDQTNQQVDYLVYLRLHIVLCPQYHRDGIEDTVLYVIGDKPNNLLVDWSDPLSPNVLMEINMGDDVTDRWGNTYTDVIEEVEFYDLKQLL